MQETIQHQKTQERFGNFALLFRKILIKFWACKGVTLQCLEISASKAAKELGLSYNTVHNKFMFFRQKIAEHLGKNFKKLSGELELDESYFPSETFVSEARCCDDGKRKGNRGRGAFNKAIVFGILHKIFIKFWACFV